MAKISEATLKNFEKLNKDLESHKFTKRANKRDSDKHIIPIEYFSNKKNQVLIETILEQLLPFLSESLDRIVDSLILSYLGSQEIPYDNHPFLKEFITSLDGFEEFPSLIWPKDERDPVGIIYQHLLTEGEKNKKGSYYTPESIIKNLVDGERVGDKTICDPCCGSGSFLIYLVNRGLVNPNNVYGYDIDKNASKIAMMNLFILNPDIDYSKRIFNSDFLLSDNKTFDYFITNPPWGSMADSQIYPSNIVRSGESYSYFIEHCLKNLGKGKLIFLLPISFLNVKTHYDIRSFVIDNYSLNTVFLFGKCFKGVLTDVIGVKIEQKNKQGDYKVIDGDKVTNIEYDIIKKNPSYVIPTYDEIDSRIIKTIQEKGTHNLMNAEFALGIVTGNNEKLLFDSSTASDGLRPILTGKDIYPIYTGEPQKFIHYNRKNFQQVCDDRFFAAKSKLIYKFISKRLCFAVDKDYMLTLNSANILIPPSDFYVDDLVLAAILNSSIMNYYFMNVVGQIKVLKNDIKNLPLIDLDKNTIKELSKIAEYSYKNKIDKMVDINHILYRVYAFNDEEINRIEQFVYGYNKNV